MPTQTEIATEHTPTPWAFCEYWPDGMGYIEGGGHNIAHVGVHDLSADENRANARLIAAAPQLLAALLVASESLCNLAQEAHPTIKVEMYEAVQLARAAIAKAVSA